MNARLLQTLRDDQHAKLCTCCHQKLTICESGICVRCWTHVRPCEPEGAGDA